VITIYRFAASVACPCGRTNEALLPVAECGAEFVWNVRCGSCGAYAWFHAREDRAFAEAILETRRRRGEEALSEEGTREAHRLFADRLAPCACGGRRHVVRRVEDEPCVACGRPLREGRWPPPESKKQVPVPRLQLVV
jgi:hypothetical protein